MQIVDPEPLFKKPWKSLFVWILKYVVIYVYTFYLFEQYIKYLYSKGKKKVITDG